MIGKFIVLEGIEACGKGTISKHIMKRAAEEGVKFVHTREPGGTSFAEALREAVISNKHTTVSGMAETMAFYAARIDHTQNHIIPMLESGHHVLCERYYASSLAYQSILCDETRNIHELSLPYLRIPDITLFMNLSLETSFRRMRATRQDIMDKIEQRGAAYFERVRDNYIENADHTYKFVDAEQPLENVMLQVDQILHGAGIIPMDSAKCLSDSR